MNKNKLWIKRYRSRITITAIFILGIMLIVNITRLIHEINYSYHYSNEASSMEYSLRQRNYPELLTMVKDNEAKGENPSSDTSEYEAFAYYYEAYVYFNMYQDKDAEKSAFYQEQMRLYEAQITSESMQMRLAELKEEFQ